MHVVRDVLSRRRTFASGMTSRLLPFRTLSILGYLSMTLSGEAQSASPTPGSSPTSGDPGQEMSQVVVTAVPPADQIVPTARPINSVFGQDMSVIDTPRSVNIITRAQIEDRQISSVQDLGQFSSGTYTPAEYGLDGIPYIRGIYAELFQNGQREIFYRNSVVPSFNQMESMDILKGPGTAVYGPSGGGLGGYVNFITKEPEFDGYHETLETTIGDYATGGQSWGHYEWSIDSTGPLIPNQLAYRLSYEGTDGTTYYRNTRDDKEDIYGSLTWIPNPALTVQLFGQYYAVRDNEVNGFNHPTQDLIDNQEYVRGTNLGPFTTITPTGVAPIYAFDSLNGPGDSARGTKLTLQMITTLTISPSLKIVNYQMYEHLVSQKYEQYGYDEYVPGVSLYDTRTELHVDYDFTLFGGSVENHDILGVAGRLQWGTTYSDFSIEPYAAYDLLANPDTFNISYPLGNNPSKYGPGGTFGGYQVKGTPFSTGINDSTFFTAGGTGDYHVYDIGIFYQHQTNWTKWLNTIVGVRGDYVEGETHLPASQLVNYYGTDEDSAARVFNFSVFAGLTLKPTADSAFYLAYDRTNGFQGDANFGGLIVYASNTDPYGHNHSVNSGVLSNLSELYEGGYKVTLFKQALYFNIDGFYQTRYESVTSPTGGKAQVQSRGVEIDLDYQPDKHLSFTSNFTYLLANYHQVAPYEQTGDYLDVYPTTFVVDGKNGTGVGSPTFTTFAKGNYSLPGTPKIYFNEYMIYKFSNGFGIGLGPQVTGAQKANVSGTLTIPAQVTWNAEIFYRRPRWEVQVNFFNFTDQHNFTVIDPTFTGNDAILEQMPFHVSVTFKLKF
jgi:iron complex outermembrane receptor protein